MQFVLIYFCFPGAYFLFRLLAMLVRPRCYTFANNSFVDTLQQHRGERRGLGGIFFDDLNDYDQEMLLSFATGKHLSISF